MKLSLKEISDLVGGTLVGDGAVVIHGAAGIKEAKPGDITFLANPKYIPFLSDTRASAVLVEQSFSTRNHRPMILCKNPSIAFSQVIEKLNPGRNFFKPGVHPTVILGKNVQLGKGVGIGPYVVIEDDVKIGDGTFVGPNSFIGVSVNVGQDCLIYPNTTIREFVSIGDRVIIHSGTVLGSDGFGYETVEGKHHKIPQVGTVIIGDDVEIGANVTVDRARFGKTIIGRGTKIDNLVQIAHNVEIGDHCMIVAQVGISGTTKIGHHVTLAGQVGLVGHIEIGDKVIITAQAGVSNNIPSGGIYGGTPAVPLQEWKRNVAHIRRLDKLVSKVKELEKKIKELGQKSDTECHS